MSLSMDEFRKQLQEAVLAAQEQARRAGPQPWHGFWHHRPDENFPPRSVRRPEDYTGGENLAIACTQTELPAKAQKALVHSWCEFLPTLNGVRYLWFQSRTPQELFDAACHIPSLEGLYVKWSGITSLTALPALGGLQALHLGSSPGVTNIDVLGEMHSLRWLELDNLKAITDLSPLASLTDLEGLGFSGAEGKRQTLATLAPLANLTRLRWLHLGAIHVADGSLHPLGKLKALRWIGLGNFFDVSEFAWLAAALPEVTSDWTKPYLDLSHLGIRCKKCRTHAMVMLSGKGRGTICPECDSAKLQKQLAAFLPAP
uniref:Leucine-rich repeat domain-containing protein n=1 Tax=Dechloromonas aromatica (strain RCB) TaxID=159087 RepID=Q47H20_DECAR